MTSHHPVSIVTGMEANRTHRTRLGKAVGSVKTTDAGGWATWFENGKWILVAPSGARWSEHETEAEALREVSGRNAEWFAV